MADAQQDAAKQRAVEPLRIAVPTTGIHFAFEKLYANQGDETAWFALAYATGAGATAGRMLSLMGAGLLWLGLGLLLRPHPAIPGVAAGAGAALGVVVLVATIGFLHISSGPAIVLSVVVILGHVLRWSLDRWKRRLNEEQAWQV